MRNGQSSGNILCFTRTPAVSWAHDGVDLPVYHSLIHAANFEVSECLAKEDSCRYGTEESWKDPHGLMGRLHGVCLQVLTVWIRHVHFCQDVLPTKMEFWCSQISEKGILLNMLCLSQELSVHRHDAVCESLWATSQSTKDLLHYETVGDFFVTNAMNMVESFLSEARQHPGMPCGALQFSSQLPASFLEEVVPVGMH